MFKVVWLILNNKVALFKHMSPKKLCYQPVWPDDEIKSRPIFPKIA